MIARNAICDFVIIIPPAGEKNGLYPPYGAMYIAAALIKNGYGVKIIDVDAGRFTNAAIVDMIKEAGPRYIGFSGIVAPSYRYIKEISLTLHAAFPDKKQILGGGLSSAADPVLQHTGIDIAVRGEGDLTIVDLIDCLDKKNDIAGVKGIHYKDGDRCIYTGNRELIGKLDVLPYPAFDLIDMDKYLPDGSEIMKYFTVRTKGKKVFRGKRERRMMTIPTSRGCFGECGFCFRAYPGLRVHSMKYVFDLVEYCIGKYGTRYFTFGDECFAPNVRRNWEFIEEYKRRKLDIVFRIFGMRVDTVDKDVLKAFGEIGCWMIEYGFESGSQKMLNIINKRATVEQNRNTAIWTRDAGIYTSPALVLAMPGETDDTVNETISFLKSLDLDWKQYQWKYALPIPGSALYDYAQLAGAIDDEDKYLSSLADEAQTGGLFHVNLTDEPDQVVATWDIKLRNELDDYYFERKYKNEFIRRATFVIETVYLHFRRRDLIATISDKIRSVLRRFSAKEPGVAPHARRPNFKKSRDIRFDEFLRGYNCSTPNREISLKNINRKIRETEASYAPAAGDQK